MILYVVIASAISIILAIALIFALDLLGLFRNNDNSQNGSSSSSTDYIVMTGLM